MGFNETCAYLHSVISETRTNSPEFEFVYDDHYCKYFEKKSSRWTLELSDNLREVLGKGAMVFVDGKQTDIAPADRQVIEIPAGLGKHMIKLMSK
jgi:hypothetical protein